MKKRAFSHARSSTCHVHVHVHVHDGKKLVMDLGYLRTKPSRSERRTFEDATIQMHGDRAIRGVAQDRAEYVHEHVTRARARARIGAH